MRVSLERMISAHLLGDPWFNPWMEPEFRPLEGGGTVEGRPSLDKVVP